MVVIVLFFKEGGGAGIRLGFFLILQPHVLSTSQAMKLYKCWVDASETKEEMEKYQLDYLREGVAGDHTPAPDQDDSQNMQADNSIKNPKPKDIKEKTTTQLAVKVL